MLKNCLQREGRTLHLRSVFYSFFTIVMLNLDQELSRIQQAETLDILELWFQEILGKKGSLTQSLKALATLSPEEKKIQGGQLSSLRTALQDAYQAHFDYLKTAEINKQLEQDLVDISLPGSELTQGHFSLLTRVRRELEDIAHSM